METDGKTIKHLLPTSVFLLLIGPWAARAEHANIDLRIFRVDPVTGEERGRLMLKGHGESVAGVVFSPDWRRLASFDVGGTVKIRDAVNGQELLTLEAVERKEQIFGGQTIDGIVFSPEGRRLAAFARGGVKIWDTTLPAERPVLPIEPDE